MRRAEQELERADQLRKNRRRLLERLLKGELPDARGRFGPFGGRYAPETLCRRSSGLTAGVQKYLRTRISPPSSASELRDWVGRPTPLTPVRHLGRNWGAEVYLKREDLAHTGAHKINNALGQALLAQRLGARRVIAETGAGQHGVATAAACARVGIPCVVYMGAVDVRRQAPNVDRMHQLGRRGRAGGERRPDAARRHRRGVPRLGVRPGGHLLPARLRRRAASLSLAGAGAAVRDRPRGARAVHRDAPAACRTSPSPASAAAPTPSGCSTRSSATPRSTLIGVEAGGRGSGLGEHAATLGRGTPGVLHGSYSMLLQDADGQVQETHSISAGLDYPGVGPEHALLQAIGRVQYVSATDAEALEALRECCAAEGILPALESAHALAGARRWAREQPRQAHPDRPLRARRQGHADAVPGVSRRRQRRQRSH